MLVVNTCCCCCFRKWVTGGGAWHRARRIRDGRSRRCCQWLREHRARWPNGRLRELGHGRFVDILHCRLPGNVARILFTLRLCSKEDIYFIFRPLNQIMYTSNLFIEQTLTMPIIPMLKNQDNGQKLLIKSCQKGSHLPPHSSQSISSSNKSSKCTTSGTSSRVHISAACLADIFISMAKTVKVLDKLYFYCYNDISCNQRIIKSVLLLTIISYTMMDTQVHPHQSIGWNLWLMP